ncbi:unnamed protein product [Amoebophrya sp. A120]|nr:unnamed protein product [Amoebophrya sp. A120]|eukprot:GSA120T00002408001.1
MACPEDYIRRDYREAPKEKYPRRHAFFSHITKETYQSTYRQDIGGFFDLEASFAKTRKLMEKRAAKWTNQVQHLSQNELDKFAVKYTGPDKKLKQTRSEPRLNSEYRDKMRGRQAGFR